MIPDYCLRVDEFEIRKGIERGWSVSQIREAKEIACKAVADRGKRVASCDFLPCASGSVCAYSSDLGGPGVFNHPSIVATVYRDGSVIAS